METFFQVLHELRIFLRILEVDHQDILLQDISISTNLGRLLAKLDPRSQMLRRHCVLAMRGDPLLKSRRRHLLLEQVSNKRLRVTCLFASYRTSVGLAHSPGLLHYDPTTSLLPQCSQPPEGLDESLLVLLYQFCGMTLER